MQQIVNASQPRQLRQSETHRLGRRSWWQKHRVEVIALPAGLVLVISLWTLITRIGNYPTFILPDPLTVLGELVTLAGNGTLWRRSQAT
jgi:ABC-type nitrate/sulfonate/bicarbonate transport system permease component